MKIKLFILPLLLCLLSIAPLFAQGGSNYSIFGIGDIFNSSGSSYEGLAGATSAVPSKHSINLKNPALWSLVDKTRLQVSYNFNQRVISSDNSTIWQNNGRVNSILTLFAIDTSLGLSVSLGMHPYSSVNYMIDTPIQLIVDEVPVNGMNAFTGTGGLSVAYIGASMKLLKDLYAGASIFAVFGSTRNTIVTTFSEANYHSSASYKQDYFSALGYRGGLYFQAARNFGIGAFIETIPNLAVESQIKYVSILNADTSFVFNEDYSMPSAFGLGANYATGNVMFTADVQMQDFTDFKYNQGANSEFRNNLALHFGVQRLGSRRINATLLNKSSYNIGAGYKQLYYNYRGTGIDEFWASFGMEMPVVNNLIINYSISLGSRGAIENGLVREMFGKLTIDMSLGELWFVPFRRQ